MDLSPEDIREILRIFAESELEELRVEVGETRLHVSKSDIAPGGRARASLDAEPIAEHRASAPVVEQPSSLPDSDSLPTSPAAPAVEGAVTEGTPPAAVRSDLFELRSPLLGTFYRRPSPDQPPFVEVGSEVEADDPVCTVDVMKMFTRVPAGIRGRVVEIDVQDGELVEHGQVLMRLEPL